MFACTRSSRRPARWLNARKSLFFLMYCFLTRGINPPTIGPLFSKFYQRDSMMDKPKRKHLTVMTVGGRTYYRVQINQKKLGLVVNKTFKDYEQAVLFLDAIENKLTQSSIKALIDKETRERKIIEEYITNPSIEQYLHEYIEKYINPKYSHLDPNRAEDRYKLRQKKSLLNILNKVASTEFHYIHDTDFKISKLIYEHTERKCLNEIKPRDLKPEDVNNLVIQLKKTGIKPNTVSDYLSKFSVFWKKLPYLDRDLKGLPNPFLMYDKDLLKTDGKRFQKKPFRFNKETLKLVAKAIRKHRNPEFRAIIHLMYKLGLRRQEAVLLRKEQIDLNNPPHILIESKGQQRIVYLTNRTINIIKPFYDKAEDRLFTYQVLGFDGSFQKYFAKTKINQHSFRKDYISRMIEQIGINNSILLSQLLGYTTPRMIERLRTVTPQRSHDSQEDLLRQIGHKTSHITQKHYFSLKDFTR